MFRQSSRNFDGNSVAADFTEIFLFGFMHSTHITKSFVGQHRGQQTVQVRHICTYQRLSSRKSVCIRVNP